MIASPCSIALEKQLGLRLEEKQIPVDVIVVDSVNRKPSDNPAGWAKALPPLALPTEFEVAEIKPTDPGFRMGRFQVQPGWRLVAQVMGLVFLLGRAFNTNNFDSILGIPKAIENDRYDITAKAASAGPGTAPMDNDGCRQASVQQQSAFSNLRSGAPKAYFLRPGTAAFRCLAQLVNIRKVARPS